MMYSAKTNGFYPSDDESQAPYIAAGNLPDDLVEISDDDYNAWFNPPDGKVGAWADGKPVLIDVPPYDYVSAAEMEQQSRLNTATTRITVWQTKLLMGRKLTATETTQLNAWMDYIDAVTAVDTSTAPDIVWPEQPASVL